MTDINPPEIAGEMPSVPGPERADSAPLASPISETLGLRVFKNIMTLIGGQGLGLALSGAATILLARYLGAAQLGEFGALYAYLGLYGWLTTFGLDTILIRQVAQNREQAGSILLTGVCVSSLFALCTTGVALVAAPFLGYGGALRGLLFFAAVDILLLAPLRLPGIVFQVDLRQWYGVGISLVRQFAWLLVLVVLAVGGASLRWIIAGRSLCAVLEVALILLAVRHKGFLSRPWRLLPKEARNLVVYGFPVAVSTLAVGVYHRIDQVMLHEMVNDRVLGNYVAAVRLTELVNVLPAAVVASLFPILAQTAHEAARFFRYLQLGFRSLMAVAFGLCIVATLFAGSIVHLLYGAKFSAAGPLLAVLIWSEIPVFFGVVLVNGLVAKNLQNYLPLSTVLGAVVNIVLNLALIPRWGAMASAWATNVSELIAAMLLFLAFRPTRPIAWAGFRTTIAPCGLAIIIVGASHFWTPPVLFALPLALLFYGVGAWVTGIVERDEILQLWRLAKSLTVLRATVTPGV